MAQMPGLIGTSHIQSKRGTPRHVRHVRLMLAVSRGAIDPTKGTSFGPPGLRVFPAGTPCLFDVAGVPGRIHIRPIFGMDMRGAGQPGCLMPV